MNSQSLFFVQSVILFLRAIAPAFFSQVLIASLLVGPLARAANDVRPCASGLNAEPSWNEESAARWILNGLRHRGPANGFPGIHPFAFNPKTESIGSGLAFHARSLDAEALAHFCGGLALALTRLNLSEQSDQKIASHLAMIALDLEVAEVVKVLPTLRLPERTSSELSDFLNFSKSLAYHAAEKWRSREAADYLHLILKSPDLLRQSAAGLTLVALSWVEADAFPQNFARLENALARRFAERGGEWMIKDLRKAGVTEAQLRAPTSAWWSRLRQAADAQD